MTPCLQFVRNAQQLVELHAAEWLAVDADHADVLLADPHRCPFCGDEHCWFINRDGRTRCVDCDEKYRRSKFEVRGSNSNLQSPTPNLLNPEAR